MWLPLLLGRGRVRHGMATPRRASAGRTDCTKQRSSDQAASERDSFPRVGVTLGTCSRRRARVPEADAARALTVGCGMLRGSSARLPAARLTRLGRLPRSGSRTAVAFGGQLPLAGPRSGNGLSSPVRPPRYRGITGRSARQAEQLIKASVMRIMSQPFPPGVATSPGRDRRILEDINAALDRDQRNGHADGEVGPVRARPQHQAASDEDAAV